MKDNELNEHFQSIQKQIVVRFNKVVKATYRKLLSDGNNFNHISSHMRHRVCATICVGLMKEDVTIPDYMRHMIDYEHVFAVVLAEYKNLQ